MSDLTELEAVNQSARALRDRDSKLKKKYPFSDAYLSYWDADDFIRKFPKRVFHFEGSKIDFVLTSDPKYKHPSKITFDPSRIIEFQFCRGDFLNQVVMAFAEFGTCELGDLAGEGIDEMKEYCIKMDEAIRDQIDFMMDHKVKEMFNKLIVELSGGKINEKDRLVKRLNHYKEVVGLYRENRSAWSEEYSRLGLVRAGKRMKK